jgi:hypothetical protein
MQTALAPRVSSPAGARGFFAPVIQWTNDDGHASHASGIVNFFSASAPDSRSIVIAFKEAY